MKDSEFLEWLTHRLVNHYGENLNVDFVLRLIEVTGRLKKEGK